MRLPASHFAARSRNTVLDVQRSHATFQDPPVVVSLCGGSCFFFSGIHEFWGSRLSQERAAESWRSASMREGIERDGEIIPPGSESRRLIPAGEAFARLSIPRLHAVLYVVEGTDSADLHRGPGHLAGSALPGSTGNCVIAGHRDTHFRLLKNVRQGNQIEIETAAGALFTAFRDFPLRLRAIPRHSVPAGSPC